MSKATIRIPVCGQVDKGWTVGRVFGEGDQAEYRTVATDIPVDPGLIVSWHAREGGGVWATVRLPLVQTMEEMATLVGHQHDDTMPEDEA